ncbi:hypothetical protein [Qipengyuania sp. 902]|uniref:hypothetical protein n=1 Tax=Qipengyuania sp. 902 TaxID=3417565 RepID=UPI003EB6D034
MSIDFPPSYPEERLLKQAVRWSFRNRYHIPSLTELFPNRSLDSLIALGREWQRQGLGSMIEVSEQGKKSVHFAFNDAAVMAVKRLDEGSLIGRLKAVDWSNWISLGALAVSVIALLKG